MFLYYYLQGTDRKVVVPMEQKLETFYTLGNDETMRNGQKNGALTVPLLVTERGKIEN